MDKDFMQLNEKELEAVVGGWDLAATETCAFMMKKTSEAALAYLREKGVEERRIKFYMDEWYKNHD